MLNNIRKLICGLLAGFVNGLLGTGGGTVIYICLDQGINRQKNTQCFMIAAICIFSALGVLTTGAQNPLSLKQCVFMLLGCIPGVLIGVKALKWASNKSIKILFSVLLIVSGVKMLL